MIRQLLIGKCIFSVVFIVSILTVEAQDTYTTISGRLLDAQTKESLPFASVYVKGKQIGTTSNNNGSFIFQTEINKRTTRGSVQYDF